jgi:hypothetical protein
MVIMLTTTCTMAQTMMDTRILLSLAAKQVDKNHIMPVREIMADATAAELESVPD